MAFSGVLNPSWKKFKIFLAMIKFEHTIFALPFAYIGALLTGKRLPSAHDLFWITVAMVGARTAAMSLNRLIDREIDAKNPRTANRALPQGLLAAREVWVYVFLSCGLLLVAAWQLSPLALKLSPLAVLILWFYSYTKRFTWACHFYLGLTLALAPVGAWVAITNGFALPPVLLGLGVLFWVAGFDIVYACMDYDFDRREGLFSLPARFGIGPALWVARGCHVLAPLFFALTGKLLGLGAFYWTGVAVAVALLFYEHRLVRADDLSRVGIAFFNLNGLLSTGMLVFTLLDILW
ncbi:4-hydroxybenzoate polyprenyltransferase [Thermodesulfitimonas autotrophica]|uniref:4-hydroxybenzoate polyprenyltransferase n=1 Tax=Thermodesulfitimonas autotrophica TaxID=1894989 RepID=A0A3N5BI82_9THEO|nr:UbiA-like polyprenyltransferase [Thermodesulfitimonas autotrophica]RPF49378.1 4-hydroxybenzoate polyprenyltransferase [Thermodesulfitimonas autotrophica]